MHMGAAKTWYAVDEAQRELFEQTAESIECGRTLLKARVRTSGEEQQRVVAPVKVSGTDSSLGAERRTKQRAAVAYHRLFFTDPAKLAAAGVTMTRFIQHPGDLMITLPGAYHGGFSHGVSVAESSNFADEEWLETGDAAAARMRAVGLTPAFDIDTLRTDWDEQQRVVDATEARDEPAGEPQELAEPELAAVGAAAAAAGLAQGETPPRSAGTPPVPDLPGALPVQPL